MTDEPAPRTSWTFHRQVKQVTGTEAQRLSAELATVVRDLLVWAREDAAGTVRPQAEDAA